MASGRSSDGFTGCGPTGDQLIVINLRVCSVIGLVILSEYLLASNVVLRFLLEGCCLLRFCSVGRPRLSPLQSSCDLVLLILARELPELLHQFEHTIAQVFIRQLLNRGRAS